MTNPSVCIIIVNWNGWRDTLECLESVFRSSYPAYQVVVVDNGSTNDSVSAIKMWAEGRLDVSVTPDHPLRQLSHPPVDKPIPYVERDYRQEARAEKLFSSSLSDDSALVVVQTGANLGFAGGNNVGIRYALESNFDFVLLLNNDTVVDASFLTYLLRAAMNHSNIGIVGGKVYFYDTPHVIQSVGARTLLTKGTNPPIGGGETDCGQYDTLTHVPHVPGALMLITCDAFRKVGLFDEDFFLYTEEVDLCYRVAAAHYDIVVEPQAQIWHKHSASSGGGLSNTYLYYSYRNRILFLKKHFPRTFLFYSLPLMLISAKTIARCGKRQNMDGMKSCLLGVFHGILGKKGKREAHEKSQSTGS